MEAAGNLLWSVVFPEAQSETKTEEPTAASSVNDLKKCESSLCGLDCSCFTVFKEYRAYSVHAAQTVECGAINIKVTGLIPRE